MATFKLYKEIEFFIYRSAKNSAVNVLSGEPGQSLKEFSQTKLNEH